MAFVDVSYDKNKIYTSGFTEQNSPLYKKKLQWKPNVLLATLQCGVNVLYMDADLFLLRDPFPYLQSYKNVDFLAQKDSKVCTGFMYFRQSHNSLQVVDVARRIHNLADDDDQHAVNKALQYMSFVNWKLLPPSLFMSGDVFFRNHQYYWDPICRLYECFIDL